MPSLFTHSEPMPLLDWAKTNDYEEKLVVRLQAENGLFHICFKGGANLHQIYSQISV